MNNHPNAKRKELKMTNRSMNLAVSAPRRFATMRAAKPFLGLAAIALLAVLSLGAGRAKADTIQTFDLTGTWDGYAPAGETISGTVTIDTTLGLFTAADVIAGGPSPFTFVDITQQPSGSSDAYADIDNAAGTTTFFLYIDAANLVGYSGGPGCADTLPAQTTCSSTSGLTPQNAVSTEFWGFNSLALSAASPSSAPEPGTVLLMGAAFLFAGLLRKLRRT